MHACMYTCIYIYIYIYMYIYIYSQMVPDIAQITFHMFLYQLKWRFTVYPKKYTHGFCFAVLCCGYTLTDFPISIRLTSLAPWQSNDCPSASKATLMKWIWINTSCEFIMNDCITTTKRSTKKPCAYFLVYTVLLCFSTCEVNMGDSEK